MIQALEEPEQGPVVTLRRVLESLQRPPLAHDGPGIRAEQQGRSLGGRTLEKKLLVFEAPVEDRDTVLGTEINAVPRFLGGRFRTVRRSPFMDFIYVVVEKGAKRGIRLVGTVFGLDELDPGPRGALPVLLRKMSRPPPKPQDGGVALHMVLRSGEEIVEDLETGYRHPQENVGPAHSKILVMQQRH